MANAHGVEESGGIKLFGTTITLNTRQQEVKKEQHTSNNDQILLEMRRPDKIIPCPRCKSMETKFCYFNNYNVNQPRHFCKGCQRYWTAGGALRNVPVGAGRRKSKPPCRGLNGAGLFPDNCLYDDDATKGQQWGGYDLEGVVENWYVMGQGGFRQVFPAKRRRNCIDDQSC